MSLPLTDRLNRPLRDLRVSVTDRCNFRCTYCMPSEIFGEKYEFLHKSKLLTFEEITRVVRLIVAQGAVKLRITGGEPLVRQELERLVSSLAQLEGVEDIAMTTNAKLLPEKAHLLKEAGLDDDAKNLSKNTIPRTIPSLPHGSRQIIIDTNTIRW